MLCPNCGHDNIQGVDLCEECGSDLAGLDLPEAQPGVAGRLLRDRIDDLPLAPRVAAGAKETVAAVVERMRIEEEGYALILDGDDLIGIFTERDLIARVLREGRSASETAVGEVMTGAPITLARRDPPAWAVHRMVSQSCHHLPIVEEGSEPVGLLSARGVLRYLWEDILERRAGESGAG